MSTPSNLPPVDSTQPQASLNPDLMGYPSVEALVAAKRASDSEAKRLYDMNQQKDALLGQIAVNGYATNSRQDVPQRRSASPEDRLTEFGVPVDALGQYVEQQIARRFEPIANGMQARGRLVANHPDYVQFENDVAQFIATDPVLAQRYPKMFEADPEAALEYAFLKFGDSRRRVSSPQGENRPGIGDATIPSSRAGEGRRVPDSSQELQTAFERFQQSGSSKDAAAYAKLRLHSVISDEFLNQ